MAIVGSPNVGKSTVFNRIIGSRKAIVNDEAGVTRDRLYGKGEWLTKEFTVIDTGGVEINNAPFQVQIRAQVEIAIDEADVVLFVTDGLLGVTNDDLLVAKMLRKAKKKVVIAVNKIDDISRIDLINDFYSLGLGDPIALSSTHGIGVGDVLDKIIHLLPEKEDVEYQNAISFSIIGRPNVGKSSLTNALLNQDRVIVSNIEGTTRDAIDTPFSKDEQDFVVIDTAGLKKRGKIFEAVDKYAAIRALAAIERSETAMVEFTKKIRDEFKFLDFASIVFLSAKNKSRINTLLPEIVKAYDSYQRRVSTSVLNDIIEDAQIINPTPSFNGGRLKIYFANQVAIKPPTFVLFCNDPSYMHFSYQRYLENRLRSSFDFEGTPIKIICRERK